MWLSIRCCFSSVFYSRCFSFGIFTARQGPAAIMRIRPVCQAVCGCTYHVSHRPSCSFSFSFGCNISFSFSQRLVAFNSWLLLSPKWCTNESGDSSNQRANGKRNTLVCYDFSSENLEEESQSQTKTTGVRMCVCMQLLIGWMDGWMVGWKSGKASDDINQNWQSRGTKAARQLVAGNFLSFASGLFSLCFLLFHFAVECTLTNCGNSALHIIMTSNIIIIIIGITIMMAIIIILDIVRSNLGKKYFLCAFFVHFSAPLLWEIFV